MKCTKIYLFSLLLLLVSALNFVGNIIPSELEMESISMELNDSEKEVDDIDSKKKETTLEDRLQFAMLNINHPLHPCTNRCLTLVHFEKIPTPPPEC